MHSKIIVESQVNIHAMCKGWQFDPVLGLMECQKLAKEKQKEVVYFWVFENEEKQTTILP